MGQPGGPHALGACIRRFESCRGDQLTECNVSLVDGTLWKGEDGEFKSPHSDQFYGKRSTNGIVSLTVNQEDASSSLVAYPKLQYSRSSDLPGRGAARR